MLLMRKIRCTECGDVVHSNEDNYLVRCRCENLEVEGGNEFLLINALIPGSFEEIKKNNELPSKFSK